MPGSVSRMGGPLHHAGARVTAYDDARAALRRQPRRWLVTGAAGFIGSHLVEHLLALGQEVTGLDNFSTGHMRNLDEVREIVGHASWRRFTLIEGDIRDPADCRHACTGIGIVLHQAALGSVPRTIEDPSLTHAVNATGFLNMLEAARATSVARFVYAASSAVYGDQPALLKVESRIGRPLSPYAVTKHGNELYADVFARCYGLACIGLRYFNVFGARQDPQGPYAAVVPKWIAAFLGGDPVPINGDGETSRDFCYIANAVQANVLAATTGDRNALNEVYNVAVSERTTLNELFRLLRRLLSERYPAAWDRDPVYRPFRDGDVRHSQADISKARALLGYAPTHRVGEGLREAMEWYANTFAAAAPREARAT
jgi:UDP-N-acetylglucosamine 4-epimerase